MMPGLTRIRSLARRFLCDEAGPTATEYAILLALIVLVSVAAITGIGSRVINLYDEINNTVPT